MPSPPIANSYREPKMRIRCHSCTRVWEVLDAGEWDKNSLAQCGYCGRNHTLAECLESQVTMKSRIFHISDQVKRRAFTDCFGEYQPATPVLVVVSTQTIGPDASSVPHYRLKAENPSARPRGEWYEGAEHMFERG